MNNPWQRSAATIALCVSTTVCAQSAEERKQISKSTSADELKRLSADFQTKFERDEARVLSYLSNHPGQPRSFERKGLTYYLARLDADGSPVFITTKGANSPANRTSEWPLKAHRPSGEGAR